jgi:hypothetical protein
MRLSLFLLAGFFFTALFQPLFGQTTHQVHLSVNQPPELFANAGNDTVVPNGTPIVLGGSPAAIGGTSPYSFMWMPNLPGLSSDTASNPTYDGSPVFIDTTFILEVTDARNCTALDSVHVMLLYISVNEFEDRSMQIYPVPARSHLNIDLPFPNGELRLLTLDGRVIQSTEVRQNQVVLQVDKLTRGTYTLIYTHEGHQIIRKIVLQ